MSTAYTFRKSAFEKSQHWQLTDQYISVTREGSRDMHIPYGRVQSIRLRYLANNRYRTNNYCCSIVVDKSTFDIYSSSYEGIASFSNGAASYVPFVKELVQRITAANPSCTIFTGQTPFVYYGNAVFVALMVILLFLVFSVLPVSLSFGILVKLLLIGYLAIFVVKSFRVNKPRQLTTTDIPAMVLPDVPAAEPDAS